MQRWNTLALPDVAWPQRRSLPARFRHLHTTVEPMEDTVAQEIGYTAWQSVDGGHPVRLGWDWALIDGGVVVVANPMSIHSNLRFTDDSGGPLMECRAVVQLHAIVHALPWQAAILKTLDHWRATHEGARKRHGRRRDDMPGAQKGRD